MSGFVGREGKRKKCKIERVIVAAKITAANNILLSDNL